MTRESPLIQDHVGLRRLRKRLLGDLSTLVKTAKKLQEMLQCQRSAVSVFELLDELVLKAFKLVTRAVLFLDICAQDANGGYRPLTPPVDTADCNIMQLQPHSNESVENSVSTFDHASVVFTTPSEPVSLQSRFLTSQPPAQTKRLSAMQEQYMRIGEGFLLVYSIASRRSFEEIKTLQQQILSVKDKDYWPIILVGNKCHLEDERQVSKLEGQGLSRLLGCPFLEVSAKTRINIDDAFFTLVREIRRFNKVSTAAISTEWQ